MHSSLDAIAQYNKIIISKKQGLTKSLQEKANDFIEKLSTKATDVFEQAWELSDGKKQISKFLIILN